MSGKYDADSPRYWINDPPGPNAPKHIDTVALVDEERGGEIAYFISEEVAQEVCETLNNEEKS